MHLHPILTLLPFLVPTVLAECCNDGTCVAWQIIHGRPGGGPKGDRKVCVRYKCADGMVHGPFGCCGLRKCNVMCCNCDKTGDGKVCRVPRVLMEQKQERVELRAGRTSVSDTDMFKAANKAGTGHMSLEELAAYFGVEVEGNPGLAAKFNLYDKNGDGYLQVDEMRLD